ncbi:MAG TPA: nucleotidyltransferase domain-containing protein [Candidatus Angelobacter sp.]|nr:nucleotidyltransferase domain-containing protein [Candidatus Angelobacter sp.]
MRRELLAYYFLNPTANHYVRELAGILQVDPTNLSRELRRLETEGLFIARVRGNQKYFGLNRGYPLFGEVRGIVLKTAGIVPVLRGALAHVPKIKEAYLYGSFAKEESDGHSDIDVLIVGEPEPKVLEAVMRRLERSFGREINCTLLSEGELRRKLARSDPFVEDIWHGRKVQLVAA